MHGVIAPFVDGNSGLSFYGGVCGIVIGPCFAAIMGLIVASVGTLVFWLITGQSLTDNAT